MQRITPFLWFDGNASEAMRFYVSIFPNSKIISDDPMRVAFELDGQEFYAINGGPEFKFTEAISFFVNCRDQDEVDMYWEKLSVGGEKGKCGWLKDKFGVSWQVIPTVLGEMLGDKDREKSDRVMKAMLAMDKIEIDALRQAWG
jgi:predicted 3-demethylubiquinone-9 3-methyltransferase (glyoxalase superfamily)